MADAKKPDKGKGDKGKGPPKPAAGEGGPSFGVKVGFGVIVAIMVLFILVPTVLGVFGTSSNEMFPSDFAEKAYASFEHFVSIISYVSIFLSLLFVCGIMYAGVMYGEVKRRQKEAEAPAKIDMNGEPGPEQLQRAGPDPRWKDVEGLMQSGNPADWRVAILEADILLEDMLTQMGYPGETIGDKLKQADRMHFKTLNEAWQAHKMRNTIAHEGSAFQLSRSDAEATIAMFKRVFDEFYFV